MSGVPVAPGMRTSAGRGVAAVVSSATDALAVDPVLWLLGILGAAVRGGAIVLALPILTIPSPVLLSVVFREQLGTSGPTEAFGILAFGFALLTAIGVLVALLISAWCDVASFERVVRSDAARELRLGRTPSLFGRDERRGLWLWVAAIQAVALIPMLVLVWAIVEGLQGAVTTEVQRPTDVSTPLVLRVLGGFGPTLFVMAVVIALGEVVVSTASRRLLTARAGCLPDGVGERTETRLAVAGALRAITRPGRVWPVAALSWLVGLGALGIALVASMVGWSITRPALDTLGRGAGLADAAGPAIVVTLMCAIWLGGLMLLGMASAFRNAMWTMESLR
ncbi:MAG: hypothetical protein KF809_07375 [Chloroflexi bacterium]|nr:hypothetical protein [Chloroflexota bacterium]